MVMVVVNRALSSPINIGCDHGDSMGARDSGWIQIYSENVQEGYDNVIKAVKIAEDENVRLPVMVMIDGFITSHSTEVLEVLSDEKIRDFTGIWKSGYSLLDVENPLTYGPYQTSDYYFESKKQASVSIAASIKTIRTVSKEFEVLSGRDQSVVETYMLDDAEIAIMVLSSTAGTVRTVIDEMRSEGIKAGLIKPRVFRPFPAKEIVRNIRGLRALAVLDRSESYSGNGGPLYVETRSSLYESELRPVVLNYIYGLGGRDIGMKDIREVFFKLSETAEKKGPSAKINYIGVRK
jgi:pyruvate ferredoxin oxidoreductase alpha subunit